MQIVRGGSFCSMKNNRSSFHKCTQDKTRSNHRGVLPDRGKADQKGEKKIHRNPQGMHAPSSLKEQAGSRTSGKQDASEIWNEFFTVARAELGLVAD